MHDCPGMLTYAAANCVSWILNADSCAFVFKYSISDFNLLNMLRHFKAKWIIAICHVLDQSSSSTSLWTVWKNPLCFESHLPVSFDALYCLYGSDSEITVSYSPSLWQLWLYRTLPYPFSVTSSPGWSVLVIFSSYERDTFLQIVLTFAVPFLLLYVLWDEVNGPAWAQDVRIYHGFTYSGFHLCRNSG